MKVTIEFHTDNAAFADDLSGELDAVLTRARGKLQRFERHGVLLHSDVGSPRQGQDSSKLFDSNGNSIGRVTVRAS